MCYELMFFSTIFCFEIVFVFVIELFGPLATGAKNGQVRGICSGDCNDIFFVIVFAFVLIPFHEWQGG